MCVGSCLFLPYSAAQAKPWPQRGGEEPMDGSTAAGMESQPHGREVAGNSLVLAECLRRHALAQKEQLLDSEDVTAKQPARPPLSDDDDGGGGAGDDTAAGAVGDLVRRLRRHGSVTLVQSEDTENTEDCIAFARRCLGGSGQGVGWSQGMDGALSSPLICQLQHGNATDRVLCGGLLVSANWRDHQVDFSVEPAGSWARVPVHAMGRASEDLSVAYLATEDDDVFVIIWLLPQDVLSRGHLGHLDLYRYCQKVLRDAPPGETDVAGSDVAATDATGPAVDVLLPRCSLGAPAAASVPASVAQVHRFGQPHELVSARLSARLPPRGALRRQPRPPAPLVLRMDGPFVVCVWHAKLDDLEVPLFAAIVRPGDWSSPPPAV